MFQVGRESGLRTGAEVGRLEGRKAGREAAAKEALKLFTIGITKEKVALLKKTFADLGTAEGVRVGKTIAREAAAKVMIVDLSKNLKRLEKKLQENNDSSKADIIKLLHKYVPIIGDYLKNHFVYNLRLESEDVNHCVRYTQTYRFIFYLYIFETVI